MHDLVIKNANLVDGSGTPAREADVAVDGDTIVEVGSDVGSGHRVIDAEGRLVTPGWVDVHTHYDAQATWDPTLAPTSWHGVTTVVMGSCGVGFAPVSPDRRDFLIGLMEGVEDIPGAAMTEGIQWEWETFPEYLDALDRRNFLLDVGTQVPHGAVRAHVMGDRGAANEPATDEDIDAMRGIVAQGLRSGALGFSTSRTLIHRAIDGRPVPGTFAERNEVFGIAGALKDVGHGIFQMASQHETLDVDIEWMDELSQEIGRPVSVNLSQFDGQPDLWSDLLSRLDRSPASSQLVGQVSGRPIGIVMGWELTAHPFATCSTWLTRLVHLPPEERRRALAEPDVRATLLSEEPISLGEFEDFIVGSFHKMYRLGSDPNYEPEAESSVAAIAARDGKTSKEVAYDAMMEDDGRGLLYFPLFNYSYGSVEHMRTMFAHPRTRLGLGDGGAHCGAICDSSVPTFMLSFWARDRSRGPRLPLEAVVRMQTSETAELFGLRDRGMVAPGYRADLNLIDFDALALERPYVAYDLPAGGRRLLQRARGYAATIKSGRPIYENGESTGAMPGRLLRGPRECPRP